MPSRLIGAYLAISALKWLHLLLGLRLRVFLVLVCVCIDWFLLIFEWSSPVSVQVIGSARSMLICKNHLFIWYKLPCRASKVLHRMWKILGSIAKCVRACARACACVRRFSSTYLALLLRPCSPQSHDLTVTSNHRFRSKFYFFWVKQALSGCFLTSLVGLREAQELLFLNANCPFLRL